MPDLYYVISTSEDGDVSLYVLSGEDLEARLAEEYWGEVKFTLPKGDIDLREVAGLIVIKGRAFKPESVQVTTRWKV